MVVFLRVPHFENNIDEGMKTLNLSGPEVCPRAESQPVEPALQLLFPTQEIDYSAVIIGSMRDDNTPRTLVVTMQSHCNRSCWSPGYEIKNMGRDFHRSSHFLRRRRVICRCCSTASSNSPSASFLSRRSKSASMSSIDFPVAHTMKMRPNLCS